MEQKQQNNTWLQKVKPFAEQAFRFLKKTFSDKKNIIRFTLAAIAIIITAQFMPGKSIYIASFWVAFLLVLVMIALLIGAKPALEYFKLPFNLIYFGLFLWLSYFLLLLFLDWILWYFETDKWWWVLLYCAIQAIFNCVIENLIEEE